MKRSTEKKPFEIRYVIMLSEAEIWDLYQRALEEGNGFDDAGPKLTVRRMFMDVGIQTSFMPDELMDIKYELVEDKNESER